MISTRIGHRLAEKRQRHRVCRGLTSPWCSPRGVFGCVAEGDKLARGRMLDGGAGRRPGSAAAAEATAPPAEPARSCERRGSRGQLQAQRGQLSPAFRLKVKQECEVCLTRHIRPSNRPMECVHQQGQPGPRPHGTFPSPRAAGFYTELMLTGEHDHEFGERGGHLAIYSKPKSKLNPTDLLANRYLKQRIQNPERFYNPTNFDLDPCPPNSITQINDVIS